MKPFMAIMCLAVPPLGLIGCSQSLTNANVTELDLGNIGSARSSPPLDSGPRKVKVLPGEPSHTQIIATKKRMISLAKIFLDSFNKAECSAYFTEEYPPAIYYDLIVRRYHVFVKRGEPNDVIEMIFDDSAEKGTIRLENRIEKSRILIGDPPTRDTLWDICELLKITRFKAIVDMYFTNGKPKEELMKILSSPTNQNLSELDSTKVGAPCSSPTVGSGRFNNALAAESRDTQIIATRDRIVSRAELFLESFEYREEYFNKEYPPDIEYDLVTDRFYVFLDGGLNGSRITMVLDKALRNANLIFPSGIGLGDAPTGNTTSKEDCQLFTINRFKALLDREMKQ